MMPDVLATLSTSTIVKMLILKYIICKQKNIKENKRACHSDHATTKASEATS